MIETGRLIVFPKSNSTEIEVVVAQSSSRSTLVEAQSVSSLTSEEVICHNL